MMKTKIKKGSQVLGTKWIKKDWEIGSAVGTYKINKKKTRNKL